MAIIIGILTVIVVGLLATLALQISIFHKEKYNEMCQTEECVRTGTVKSRFSFFSPPSVSPCNVIEHTEILHFNSNYPYIRIIYIHIDLASIRNDNRIITFNMKIKFIDRSSRQDNRCDEQIGRSLPRFLQICLQRLGFKKSYTAKSDFLGSIELSQRAIIRKSENFARGIRR